MRFVFIVALFLLPAFCFGQVGDSTAVRSSAAYAELIVRKTELQSDIEAFSVDYTATNPKLLDLRFELTAIERSLTRVLAIKAVESGKLTLGVGKLLVKKASLETELGRLLRSYNQEHPEVKRAKRRVEIFETAINELVK